LAWWQAADHSSGLGLDHLRIPRRNHSPDQCHCDDLQVAARTLELLACAVDAVHGQGT